MVSQDGIWMISPHAEHDRQKDVHVGQPLETSRAEQQPLLELKVAPLQGLYCEVAQKLGSLKIALCLSAEATRPGKGMPRPRPEEVKAPIQGVARHHGQVQRRTPASVTAAAGLLDKNPSLGSPVPN